MRILLFNFEYPPLGGGGGVATKQLAEELAKKHEVHIITTGYKALKKQEVCNQVYIHRVPVLGRHSLPTASLISLLTFVPVALFKGWWLCLRQKFDVINAQFAVPSGPPAAFLAWWFNIPFVLSFIGGDIYDPSKGSSPHRHFLLRWVVRLVARCATLCTAISHDTARRALELHNVKKEIIVTPIGLIPTSVVPASREELGLPEHVPVFVSVGRLIPRKGYKDLLKAWQEIPTAHLVIIGSGPLENELHNLIQTYDLAGRVYLLGFVSEAKKQQILRASTAYISAAEHEGFGIVFLEAMEAGLPIIATDNGGQTDFLTAGENALLIPAREPYQLVGAIVWLLKDSRLREIIARNNKEKVKEYYLSKTAVLFENVLVKARAKYAHRT